jgi:hypothetical protein
MRKRIVLPLLGLALMLGGVTLSGCDKLNEVVSQLGLSNEDIVKGLRTALDSSANASSLAASKLNGFLMNELIKIAAPPEVVDLKSALDNVAANPLVDLAFTAVAKEPADSFLSNNMDDLVASINHAAEKGSEQAYPIFKKAITEMTITDGLKILQGGKTSATDYLREKTYKDLVAAFAEPIRSVVESGEVSRLWKPVAEKYNKVRPLVSGQSLGGYTFTGPEHVNEDLSEYITEKAMDGLFKLVAQEEAAIRENPKKYASGIIQKVFGSLEAKAALK